MKDYLTDVKLEIQRGIPYGPTFFKASTENSNGLNVISCTGLSGRVMCNLQYCLGDFARLLKVHFTSSEGMSTDAPINECESEINHYTSHYVPYSSRRASVWVL